MRLLLDTYAYSAVARGNRELQQAIEQAEEICLSPIVIGELRAGFLHGSRVKENERGLRKFLALPGVSLLVVAENTAARYAEIVAFLRKAGTPIPTNDIWIAASALEHGLRLLTTDAHFRRIPFVAIETGGTI